MELFDWSVISGAQIILLRTGILTRFYSEKIMSQGMTQFLLTDLSDVVDPLRS